MKRVCRGRREAGSEEDERGEGKTRRGENAARHSRFDTRARETPAPERAGRAVIGRVTRREFCGNGAATRSLINNEHVPATSS